MKDSTGRYLTRSLFVEFEDGRFTPQFTLANKDNEKRGIPSLRRLYMEYEDPHEGRFAAEVFGSYAHWKKLCDTQWFKAIVTEWREELEAKLASDAFVEMKRHAKKSAPAARWIAEKGWRESGESKRGRPSKEEVARRTKEDAEERKLLRDISVKMGSNDEDD